MTALISCSRELDGKAPSGSNTKFIVYLVVLQLSKYAQASDQGILPNIVLFLADDLGIGDVGVFGNNTINTPNIDSIAHNGAKLTHHLAASSVCTPSRTAFLTGRYPLRSGMTPSHIVRVNIFLSSTAGLPPGEVTFAELAKEKGYRTAIIGKWHLGLHCSNSQDFCHHPLHQGFDYFYGMPLTNLKDFGNDGYNVIVSKFANINDIIYNVVACVSLLLTLLWWVERISISCYISLIMLICVPTHTFFWIFSNLKFLNGIIMRNYEVVQQPVDLQTITQRLVSEGVQFIESSQSEKQPFLLVMSWLQVHTVLHSSSEFRSKSKHGPFGDNVEEMDWSVGQILHALEQQGITNDTFIYFSSDNGGHIEEQGLDGEREGGHNGIFRGGKGQGGSEGGIRVPTTIQWPGHIPQGINISTPTSMMDMLPTLVALWNGSLPPQCVIDGKNLLPLLTQVNTSAVHDYLFHYCGVDIHAARYITSEKTNFMESARDMDCAVVNQYTNTSENKENCGGSAVYKAHYVSYRWHPGTEGCGFMCNCYGNDIIHNNPPILYEITSDPSEINPLDPTQAKHKDILNALDKARDNHVHSISPVADQYAIQRMLPRPWLQPCCNFPKCRCKERKHNP